LHVFSHNPVSRRYNRETRTRTRQELLQVLLSRLLHTGRAGTRFFPETVILMSDEPRIKKIYTVFFGQVFPADLKIALVWLTINILVIYFPVLNESPVRVVLTLPGILFLPGYCLIAALYPKDRDIELIERVALSFGLSIAVVPLIVYGLNFTPWGIRLDSVVLSLTVFTWVLVLFAHYRRAVLPFEERFSIPFSEIAGTFRNAIFSERDGRIDRLLTLVLSLAILVAILVTVFVIAVPREGERFTEFFILGEKQKVADYPDQISIGQNYPLYIGVGNHEYQNVTYTVETWGMFTDFDNVTNTSRIMVMDLNERQSLTLAHNETLVIPYTLSLNKTGYNRVEFLLFNESVPGPDVIGSDRINASYHDLYLMVTVREAENQELSN